MSITSDSRYAPQLNPPKYRDIDTDERYLGLRWAITLAPADDDAWERPRPSERWDTFVHRLWKHALGERAAGLWWIVCDLNDVVNPLTGPDPAKRYRVPSAERVALEVLP